MKLLKHHAVAMILTILVIVGCSAVGYFTKPDTSVADLTSLEYGKQNYTAYLDWIADDADLLSDKTEQAIATYMGAMEHGFGGIVAVMTTKDLGGADIDQYAYDAALDADLRGMDMILLLDKGTDNWYMLPGADMQRYADAKLQSIVTAALSKGSVVRDADKVLPDMFQDMFGWYEANLSPVEDSGGFGFVFGLIVMVLILCVMFGSMGIGYRRYGYGFWGPFWGPIFYPHRFPGGPHSRGYHHRHDPHHYSPRPTPPHRDHNDRGPGGFGGFGGGGFGGGGRGGGFGGGGGGFGGGGFGGGGRGGGFGGGGGGFGGGGFGGGGRGGGFGG